MKKILFVLIFLANIGVIFYFWFSQSGALLMSGQAGFFISLGRICGLLAVYFILWQLVLIGRIKFLEQSFGLDRLAILHHFNGLLAWLFIFLHPLFLVIGHSQVNQANFFSQVLDFLFNWDDLAVAYLAVGIFLITIILSLGTIQKKLKYEVWYFIHLLTYLAIIWSFGHQLELGSDLQNLFFVGYWYLIYTLAVASLVLSRFLKPLYFFYQHRFQVAKIEIVSEQVVSIYLQGVDLEKFKFRGGQFAIFRFLNKNLFWEAHPFSFSQAFNGQYLRITIKNLGDFTASLKNKLQPGDFVFIDGPHGIFTSQRTKNNKLALIAGGIGITPLAAIIAESLQKPNKQEISLFYAGATRSDLILKKELDDLQLNSQGRLKIHYILSQETTGLNETGRFNEEKLKRLLPEFKEYDFFLCGPPLMLKNVKKTLRNLQVSSRKIYYEKFSLN